ncbi:MAG: extracellular solute-binding protein [Roseburia sp.]|nr:extracellular solute-binding protein [Roseburia sp.]MCM1098670.1 extracellular solute-binding protein [Ruminococcus flavefaciens]
MHIKKRLTAAVSVLALAAAVLYGSTLEMNAEQEEGISLSWFDREDTIYFWYSDESMESFINSAAVSFGEREGIHVIPVLASDSEYLEAVSRASVREEQMPDAYIVSHDSLEKAYLAGLAAEIEDEAGVCGEEKFPAAALSAISYHGKQVAYPLSFETSALVYNETYLAEWARQAALRELTGGEEGEDGESAEEIAEEDVDEAALAAKTQEYFQKAVPRTVDDILTIADTFDLPENVEGIMKWAVSDIFYNYWFVGDYMIVGGDAGDDGENISVNNPETISCLEVYKALNQFFFIESDTVTYESAIQDFMDGKIVFTIATTDVAKRLEQAKQDGTLPFDYGIAMMPDVSEELKSRSMSVTNTVAVNGYSRHKEMANKFAAYLVDECAGSLYDMTGKAPANLYTNAGDGAIQIFKLEYAESIPLPKMMATGNFWLLLERLFAKAWDGDDVTALTQELEVLLSFQTDAVQ